MGWWRSTGKPFGSSRYERRSSQSPARHGSATMYAASGGSASGSQAAAHAMSPLRIEELSVGGEANRNQPQSGVSFLWAMLRKTGRSPTGKDAERSG